MLWPSRKKRTTRTTIKSNRAIPSHGEFPPAGSVVFIGTNLHQRVAHLVESLFLRLLLCLRSPAVGKHLRGEVAAPLGTVLGAAVFPARPSQCVLLLPRSIAQVADCHFRRAQERWG